MEAPSDFVPCDKCIATAQSGSVVKLCDDCAPKWSEALPPPPVYTILITLGHNAAGLYVSKEGVNFIPEYHEWKLSQQQDSAYRFFHITALPVMDRLAELGFTTQLNQFKATNAREK